MTDPRHPSLDSQASWRQCEVDFIDTSMMVQGEGRGVRKSVLRVGHGRWLSVMIVSVFCLSMLLSAPISSFSNMSNQADRSGITGVQQTNMDGTTYIRADGSIEPQTAPIRRDGDNYTLTGDILGSVVVERDNMILDGAGYAVEGLGAEYSVGVFMEQRENVEIRNVEIRSFGYGIHALRSQHILIIGNNITADTVNSVGIMLESSPNNAVLRNNITNSSVGVRVDGSATGMGYSNNILQNAIMGNGLGIFIRDSVHNAIAENFIGGNGDGIWLTRSSWLDWWSGNYVFHNNFVDNDVQADSYGTNGWDDGYPSGGNYWSDYDGVDEMSGPNQDQPGSDGIGDTPYLVDSSYDRYPLMSPWTSLGIHDIVAYLQLAVIETLGRSSWLNATVTNQGTVDEVDVEVLLAINGSIVKSSVISLLESGESRRLGYLWTPAGKGEFNVTISASLVSGDMRLENNVESHAVAIWEVGVHAGDWVKYAYSYGAEPAGVHTEWVMVEVIDIVGTTATIRGTLHLSNGSEMSEVYSDDFTGEGMVSMLFDTLSAIVVPANLTSGDMVCIGYKVVYDVESETYDKSMLPCASIICNPTGYAGTRAYEVEKTYMGAPRTVLCAEYSSVHFDNGPITCCWEKQTGLLLEMSCAEDNWSVIVVDTNAFDSTDSTSPDNASDPTVLYALLIAAVSTATVALFFVIRRRRKHPEDEIP
jgi:hypothetical protein